MNDIKIVNVFDNDDGSATIIMDIDRETMLNLVGAAIKTALIDYAASAIKMTEPFDDGNS